MNRERNTISFVNHASVLISGDQKSLLTDPWYEGDAFNKGWRLIYENDPHDIDELLTRTNYIWISHEHPDHFSVAFFQKFKEKIQNNHIVTLFQRSHDGRVIGYLRKQGFEAIEVANNVPFRIEDNFTIRVVKDEFYDSALLAEVGGIRIFNLNDCPIRSVGRIRDFKKRHGTCDILLTQFSYAAWKGGRNNRAWREVAAREKLNSLLNQGNILEATVVIPFASFVRFSNTMNSYLNDAVNTPTTVMNFCGANGAGFKVLFLQPLEAVPLPIPTDYQNRALEFWEERYKDIPKQRLDEYSESFSVPELRVLFQDYCDRIKRKNSWMLVKLLGRLEILGAFAPITIKLTDTNEVVLIDIPHETLAVTTNAPAIQLHSESLAFILKNPFGFDTLMVNGNFEEAESGGFRKLTMNFAIENLNNLGHSLSPALIFDLSLISIFLRRLIKVEKSLH